MRGKRMKSTTFQKNNNEDEEQEQEKFQCPKCLKLFKTKRILKIHILRVHEKCKDYICKTCKKPFFTSTHMERHILISHGDKQKDHICRICNKAFALKDYLKRHNDTVHEGLKKPKKRKNYCCKTCGRVFSRKGGLKTHIMAIHHGIKYASKLRLKNEEDYKKQIEALLNKSEVHESAKPMHESVKPESASRAKRLSPLRDPDTENLSFGASAVKTPIGKKPMPLKNSNFTSFFLKIITIIIFSGSSGNELFTCEYCPGFWTCNLSRLNKHNRTKSHQKKMKSEATKINDFDDDDENKLPKGEVFSKILSKIIFFLPFWLTYLNFGEF